MWEPSEKEARDCLEHGKSCGYGICSECVITTGGYKSCINKGKDVGGEAEETGE